MLNSQHSMLSKPQFQEIAMVSLFPQPILLWYPKLIGLHHLAWLLPLAFGHFNFFSRIQLYCVRDTNGKQQTRGIWKIITILGHSKELHGLLIVTSVSILAFISNKRSGIRMVAFVYKNLLAIFSIVIMYLLSDYLLSPCHWWWYVVIVV